MKLPRQEAHQLLNELDRLEGLRKPSVGTDAKRQFKRFVIRGDVELHPMSRNRMDSQPITVQVRDIGRGGLGFVTEEPLPQGSSWRACFLQDGYVIGEQALVVRHCREVSEDLYLIGTQYVINSGLLAQLGIDPAHIDDGPATGDDLGLEAIDFLPPNEVA